LGCFEADIASSAEDWARKPGREGTLPIMNRRRGAPSHAGGERYLPRPPQLYACDELLPYYLIVGCNCGRLIEMSGADGARLIGKAGRAPIGHLLSLLTCGKCGGRPAKLEIVRHADRGLANAPRQTVMAASQPREKK